MNGMVANAKTDFWYGYAYTSQTRCLMKCFREIDAAVI